MVFFLALADAKSDLAQDAKAAGLTRKSLESAIEAVRGGQSVNSADAEGQREALKKYCLDLTERAHPASSTPSLDEMMKSAALFKYCNAHQK